MTAVGEASWNLLILCGFVSHYFLVWKTQCKNGWDGNGNDDSHWWVIIMQLYTCQFTCIICVSHTSVDGIDHMDFKTTSNAWTAVPATCLWTITGNLKNRTRVVFLTPGVLTFFSGNPGEMTLIMVIYLPTEISGFFSQIVITSRFQIADPSFRVLRLPSQNCGNWLCLVLLADVLPCGWIWNTELG